MSFVIPMTEAEREIAVAMRLQGEKISIIAMRLNRSESGVKGILKRHRRKETIERVGITLASARRSHNDRGNPIAERITLRCLCCERPFQSVDRRKNRLCVSCKSSVMA